MGRVPPKIISYTFISPLHRVPALLGIELCRALAAVHAKNLVHGDVKGQNVMREEGGRIVLMDFGLVRGGAAGTSVGRRLAGTPVYMAPELMRGETVRITPVSR